MTMFTQKWSIIIPLESVSEGKEYEYTRWPLHITLASVFATKNTGAEIGNKLKEVIEDLSSFNVTTDTEDWFGPQRTVGVMKLNFSPELRELYEKIHAVLTELGAEFNEPQYEGTGYVPHSAYQKTKRLTAGQHVTVRRIALIDMFPDADGYKRRVTKIIDLVE